VGVVHALPSSPTSLFPKAPLDPAGVLVHTHPVPYRMLGEKRLIPTIPFHWVARESSFHPVISDFPMSHIYEDLDIVRAVRGIRPSETFQLRNYEKRYGVYWGVNMDSFPEDTTRSCFYFVRDRVMHWEFLTPQLWREYVSRGNRYGTCDYTGWQTCVLSRGKVLRYPPFWGRAEIIEASYLHADSLVHVGNMWKQEVDAQVSLSLASSQSDLDEDLVRGLSTTPEGSWLLRKGFLNHVEMSKKSYNIRAVGISQETKGFLVTVPSYQMLVSELSRWFVVRNGSFDHRGTWV